MAANEVLLIIKTLIGCEEKIKLQLGLAQEVAVT